MINALFYSLISVILVSLISLIGILTFSINPEKLKKILLYFVSFSAGALFGDAFIHLLPSVIKQEGLTLNISLYVLSGILFSFIVEKIIHWRHCHYPTTKEHPHPFAIMNLVGDVFHNLIDGLIIGASYLISIHTGIATTLAVILHEIPQEIGDFGVLLHGGFTKTRALLLNFITALTSVLGAIIAFSLSTIENTVIFLIPFAAGNFIYIAGSDLIPEIHRQKACSKAVIELFTIILGIVIMILLTFLE